MAFIAASRFVATHPASFLVLILTYGISLYFMQRAMDPWSSAPIPDLSFGFTPSEIRNLMRNEWGEDGCRAYSFASLLDLFPYMESYGLVLGGLLVLVAQRQQWDVRVVSLAGWTVLMDVFEVTRCLLCEAQWACRNLL